MRKITIFSQRGGQKTIEVKNNLLAGELREKIQEAFPDINIDHMEIIDGITRSEYIATDSKVSDGDIHVFLTPKDSKAGLDFINASFREMRSYVKKYPEVKDYLNNYIPGKNWTQLRTDELRSGLIDFGNKEKKSRKSTKSRKLTKKSSKSKKSVFNIGEDFLDMERKRF